MKTAKTWAHLYDRRWRKARARFLCLHPTCHYCAERGEFAVATVVNHHQPHRGDVVLFWDESNWRSACQPCHDRDRQRVERSGRVLGCDITGTPTDPAHPWNTELNR